MNNFKNMATIGSYGTPPIMVPPNQAMPIQNQVAANTMTGVFNPMGMPQQPSFNLNGIAQNAVDSMGMPPQNFNYNQMAQNAMGIMGGMNPPNNFDQYNRLLNRAAQGEDLTSRQFRRLNYLGNQFNQPIAQNAVTSMGEPIPVAGTNNASYLKGGAKRVGGQKSRRGGLIDSKPAGY